MEMTQDVLSNNGEYDEPDPLTVGEAVDSWLVLRDLDPSVLGKEMTDEVMDALDELQPIAEKYMRRLDKHRERLADEDGNVDEAELEEALADYRAEETDVRVRLDISKARSTGAMHELRSIGQLQPLL